MKKEEFLNLLREKISILEENEIKDIINEYDEHIEEEKKKNKKEEIIVNEFGNINDLAKEILLAYKINGEELKEEKKFNINKYLNKVEKIIEKITDKFSTNSLTDIFKFIVEVGLIIFLIYIMKFPFDGLKIIGTEILETLFSPLDDLLIFIWELLIYSVYLIIGVLTFIGIFEKRYNLNNNEVDDIKEEKKVNNRKKIITKKQNEIKEEKQLKIKQNIEQKNKESISNLILIIIKAFIIICTLPFIFSLIGLCVALAFVLALTIDNLIFVGILITIIALVLGNLWIIGLVVDFIINRKLSFKKTFLLLVGIILLLIFGLSLGFLQFKDVDYDNNSTILNKNYKIINKEIIKEYNNNFISTYSDKTFVVDNKLGNKVKLNVMYYKELSDIMIDEENGVNLIYVKANEWKIFKKLLDDLKTKKIYNYDSLSKGQITITASEENINKIKNNS